MTRLWTGFVLGWLGGLAGTAVWLINQPHEWPGLAFALFDIALFAALYLWITMRGAIGPGDLTPEGPSRATVRTRLLLLAAMVIPLTSLWLAAPNVDAWWLALYIVIAAGLALPARTAVIVMAVLIAAIMLVALLAGRFDPNLFIQIAFGAAASAVRSLTISVAQLNAARAALAHAAVDQERLRFSRDLHDILGHTLSVIILKSELAGRLLPGAPPQAAAEISDIERAARDAQRQIRAAVRGYRQPGLHSELEGARELLVAAGVEPIVTNPIRELPSPLDGLLAWAVREGVTNVVRHSRARRCEISLTMKDGSICLTVLDDGSATTKPNGGSGLAGLAERAAAHGGVLEAGPRPEGGFQLVLTAPVVGRA